MDFTPYFASPDGTHVDPEIHRPPSVEFLLCRGIDGEEYTDSFSPGERSISPPYSVVEASASSASSARSSNLSPGENVIEEELTSEQIAYYRDIFVQYD